MNKIQFLGISLGASLTLGLVLLMSYVYVILYNYLYKKYRSRLNKAENLFNVSTSKETFVSMLDVVLIISLFSIRIITIKDK